jgi:hypothetical protein
MIQSAGLEPPSGATLGSVALQIGWVQRKAMAAGQLNQFRIVATGRCLASQRLIALNRS